MPLSWQLSFKSWNTQALVATTPEPYWDVVALSTSWCHPHCQGLPGSPASFGTSAQGSLSSLWTLQR